ncbi:hypothetical protein GCM10008937_20290 [Deinococcus depolymerans]|uniref:Uncharacterized protein n=1 Tax=Deinococcus depolymerans TaxID=392408 RepID=A0ABP3M3E0_9DEIO
MRRPTVRAHLPRNAEQLPEGAPRGAGSVRDGRLSGAFIRTPIEWLIKPFNPSGCDSESCSAEKELGGFRTWS